jgi:O-antigen/teichoic acid export membrane protein
MKTTETTKKRTMTESAVLVMFAKILAYSLNIALPMLLVRRLSQSEFGLYKQSFLVVASAVAILPFGFGMSAFYFLPREKERRGGIIFNILLFNLLMGSLALAALAFHPDFLANILIGADIAAREPQMKSQIIALAPLIGAVIFFWLFSGFLETSALANQETARATVFIVFAQFTKAVLLLSAAILFSTVHALLYAALIQGVLQTVILFSFLRKRFESFWKKFDFQLLKKQLLYALPYSVSGVIWTLQLDLHNYFVSHHFGQIGFAIYSVGVFQLPLFSILGESVASVMIPQISYLQSVGDKAEIIRLTTSAIRRLAFFYLPSYFFFLVMAREFIVAIFTEQYVAAVPIFLINITLLLLAVIHTDSIVRAYPELGRFGTKLQIALLVLLFVGLWLAAKTNDLRLMIGVAVATLVIGAFVITFKTARTVGFKWSDFALLKDVWKIVAAAMIAALGTFIVRHFMLPFNLKALLMLCIGSAVFGIIYLIAVLLLRIPTDKEYEMVLSVVRRPLFAVNGLSGSKTNNAQLTTDN